MSDHVTEELFQYAVCVRRQLHQYPELGFELPQTVRLVTQALEEMGIPHTDRFGTCSVVGYVGPDNAALPTLAIRADMDALPIQEMTGLPYASQIQGRMHACGHDSHTAILLAVAKALKQESQLPCNIRLLFQPSEEGADSGAKIMVDNGVMAGVDAVICAHCDNQLPAGSIGIHPGDYMAACIPVHLTFHGKTSHATIPEKGVDAVAMGVAFYSGMKALIPELAGDKPYIWSVGKFSGGEAANLIADHCRMEISFRYYDEVFGQQVMAAAEELCHKIAEEYGGSAEVQWHITAGAVCNDAKLTSLLATVLNHAHIPVRDIPRQLSSEDFSWYLQKAPGLLFRFGTGNAALGCTSAIHQNDFRIDETGMQAAIRAFTSFALAYGK